MKRVVSFSLFGNADLYCKGAIENAKLCSEIYEGWECRVYYSDDVPTEIIDELLVHGAITIKCDRNNTYDGLFWRFKPLNEDDVSIWISRDCDSRVTQRDKVCVDEWIVSGKPVHLIRDAHNHVYEIMAGMFGINNNIFKTKYEVPNLTPSNPNSREDDQTVLTRVLWPLIKHDHLCHDYWAHNTPNGEPKFLEGDTVQPNEAYGCGLVNYVVSVRNQRHDNLYVNKDNRDFPKHDSIDYGIFVGQRIDANNKPIFDMTTHWEYEIRGINYTL